MHPEPEPRLAAPGAGLPKIELIAARFLFWWMRRRGSREAFTARFEQERDAILAITRARDKAFASRKVLIPRLRGLEDSSRNWSIWMTLDHLRIVNTATAEAIRTLLGGKVPERVASTAAVKPDPSVNESAVAGFKTSCEDFLESVTGTPNLQTDARYKHPWFGPLNAAGWHALGGMHMGLHRRQIECIVSAL